MTVRPAFPKYPKIGAALFEVRLMSECVSAALESLRDAPSIPEDTRERVALIRKMSLQVDTALHALEDALEGVLGKNP